MRAHVYKRALPHDKLLRGTGDSKPQEENMALRWYTVVVDCQDVRTQAAWAEALDWTINVASISRPCHGPMEAARVSGNTLAR